MLSVLVWMEAESETLHELMDNTVGLSASVLFISVFFHALNEINYCSFVDIKEEFGHPELYFWVSDSVLLKNLFNEEFLHLIYCFLMMQTEVFFQWEYLGASSS